MQHTMKLRPAPFFMIKSGQKTIELRLYDEKRKQLAVDDTIRFVNTEDGTSLEAKVTALHLFDTFEALYQNLPLLQCGYTEKTIDMAKASDMEAYYSKEEQELYGVVGIELILS